MPALSMFVMPLAHFLLAYLLIWFVIGCSGKWGTKVAFMILVPAVSLGMWKALDSYGGRPTHDPTPERAVLEGFRVDEPNPQSGNKGAIYLMLTALPSEDAAQHKMASHPWWLVPVEKVKETYSLLERQEDGEPRTYVVPYTRQMHQGAEKAMQSGKRMYIRNPRKGGSGGGPMRGGSGDSSDDSEDSPNFYKLPPPNVPSKNP